MTHEEIQKAVMSILNEQKHLTGQLEPTTLLSEAGLDSLDALNVLFALEERFNISIPDDEAKSILTLGDLVTTIEKRLPA